MHRLTAALTAALLMPLPALADEITDALTSAQTAYAEGDIQYAIEELDFARGKLLALKTDALSAYLPDAPEGWTRTVNSEMNAGMAMMGGGVGAEARYTSADGAHGFTLTLMADNPMVASLGSVVQNATMMGLKVTRIGRQKFVIQEGDATGLINNRILIQASGDAPELMLATLETIDFQALASFGN